MRLPATGTVMLLLTLLSNNLFDQVSGDFRPQVEALLALKRGFNDPIALASWNMNSVRAPCYGWRGIICQNNSVEVTMIILRNSFRGGTISPAIGGLPSLQKIDLSHNALSGIIPPDINGLNNLTFLDLSENMLIGSLPANWDGLRHLTMLNLRLNRLNGTIPAGLSEAVSLQRLRFENNGLFGEIPPEICALGNLMYFAIEYNSLTGAFPEEIGNLTKLRSVYAAYNQLSSSLPESIVNLTRLRHFEVEGNNLSGSIPPSFAKSLHTLNLSHNNFSGQVPVSLATFSAASFANNPYLCGIPLPSCSPPEVPRPTSTVHAPPPPKNRPASVRKARIVGGTVGGVLGALALFILLVVIRRRSDQRREDAEMDNWFSPDIQANRRKGKFEMFGPLTFPYLYEEIVSNAGFFDTAHILGKGRFATVYRSSLPNGTELAVKVFKFANLSPTFESEIVTLSSIRHRHILSIRGLYANQVEKAIFYDYLPRGTLYDLLHTQGTHPSSLPDWAARQRIAFGVAQALSHLHRGCNIRFCHRDVKSTNILLGSDLTPYLSDVGLTPLVSSRHQESTTVVETPGYTAPEVLTTKKYSEKADVYSYGVVLMELITGKRAIYYIGERAVNLQEWVTRLHREKRGREIMDTVAYQTCPFPEYMDRALGLAIVCVDENPFFRPSMTEVASVLEGLASNPSPLRSPDLRDHKSLLP